jgi:hypothetical protein
LDLLAAYGRRALAQLVASVDPHRYVILDGTCIRIDRVADRRYR